MAKAVTEHKSYFFIEKDTNGAVIDYFPAADGKLQIVPEGAARDALATDYANMLADEVMVWDALHRRSQSRRRGETSSPF